MPAKPLFANGWEVRGITSAKKFFSSLPELIFLPVNMCFEGTSISGDVRAFLASHSVAPTRHIPTGTIWPKPTIFHVNATTQFIHDLAILSRKHAEPEICDHFHAYKGSTGLMQWYDAFDLPLLVEESIGLEVLQTFCEKMDLDYSPWRAT